MNGENIWLRHHIRRIAHGGLLLLVFFCLIQTAWALDPAKEFSQYVHDSWNLDDGLPQASIYAITQGPDGYLWLGTEEGLVRFDGVRFTVYDRTRLEHLEDNFVNVLHKDQNHNLWLGTYGGALARFDLEQRRSMEHIPLPDDEIRSLYPGGKNSLWIGTTRGLYRLEQGKVFPYGLSEHTVYSVFEDRSKHLWFGTSAGLYRLHRGRPEPSHPWLGHKEIWAIHEDNRGHTWIGTSNGLYRLDGGLSASNPDQPPVELLPGHIIRVLHPDGMGNLWVGSSQGLYRANGNMLTPFTRREGLTDNLVLAVYEDHEGSLWIGTNKGLNRLKDGNFTSYTDKQGLVDSGIWSIREDHGGGIWYGTNHGLYYNRDGKISPYAATGEWADRIVWAACEDRENTMWFGVRYQGLFHLKDGRFINYTTEHGLSDNSILSIHEDRSGLLWLGTENGLNRLDPQTMVFTRYFTSDGLSNNYIRFIHEDRKGNLWLGTRGGGITLRDAQTGKFSQYTTENGLSNNNIRAIHEDAGGTFWIGTRGGGINRFKDGIFTPITVKDGLYDETIHRILEDHNRNLWMSTNKGVFRVNLEELNRFCDGNAGGVQSIVYNESDGMKSRECNGVSQPGGWKCRDGRLWFPTMRGAVMVDPGNIEVNPLPPAVVMEEIVVDDDEKNKLLPPYPTGKQVLRFRPGRERFRLFYTGLSFLSPRRLFFLYKLEGFDQQWRRSRGTERSVLYTNLSPGDYTFRVKARNNDGRWNETGASVSFYLEPHFYQTPWFFVLCGLFLLFCGFGIYRFRLRLLYKHRRRLEREVAERTEQLQGANIELETLLENLQKVNNEVLKEREAAESASRAKGEFLANMSHEIRTPMNAILGYTELLEPEITEEHLKHYLGAISSSGKTLLGLINDILDLSMIEAGKIELQMEPVNPRSVMEDIRHIFSTKIIEKALTLRIETDPALPELLFLDGLRLRQVLFNLVGNAVKFTHRGGITLSARRAGPAGGKQGLPGERVDVAFAVKDTGIGIPRDQQRRIFESFTQRAGQRSARYGGTGLGLSITSRLVEIMGGAVSLHSEVGSGSTFRVTLKNIEVPGVDGALGDELEPDVGSLRFEKAVVLVVDDNALNRGLLISYLNQSSIHFVEAENGREALELARHYRPDLVLMDLKMPVMDGFEATRRIKSDDGLKDTPVVIVTAFALREEMEKIKKAGGDGFLNKPVSKSALFIELTRFLSYYTADPAEEDAESEAARTAAAKEETMVDAAAREKRDQWLPLLEAPGWTRRCDELRRRMVVNEIEDFLNDVFELAREYHLKKLFLWCESLELHIRAYNPEKTRETLAQLPGIIKDITEYFQEKEEK